MWHRDFPPDAREMWDVIAKALLLRIGSAGSAVSISDAELRIAQETQAEIYLCGDGAILFRVERQ